MKKINDRLLYVLCSFVVILIDFVIKRLVILKIKESGGFTLMGNIIKVTYLENTGAAFGVFGGKKFFLILMSIAVMIGILVIIFKNKIENKIFLLSTALVIGGGIGNLIDRVTYGYVIDYIKLSFFPSVCNFADYCITFGIIGLIFYIIFIHKNNVTKE